MQDIYGRYAEALRLGHQRAAEGRFKDALGHYQAAAELGGELRALPHVAVGGMYLRLGKVREALAAYERALSHEPDDVDALTGRAAALLAAGRRGEAAQVHDRITHGVGSGPADAAPAGDATPTPSTDRLMAAGEDARASRRPSAAIDAWVAESAEHRAAEHYDAALDACLRALALDSSATRSHLELCRVWLARGWNDLATERIKLLERLLALQPDAHVSAALRDLAAQAATPATAEPAAN